MVISNEKKIGNEERFTFYFNVQKIIPKWNLPFVKSYPLYLLESCVFIDRIFFLAAPEHVGVPRARDLTCTTAVTMLEFSPRSNE